MQTKPVNLYTRDHVAPSDAGPELFSSDILCVCPQVKDHKQARQVLPAQLRTRIMSCTELVKEGRCGDFADLLIRGR